MKMVFHIVLRQTRAKFDMLSICTCSYRALNLMMQSPSPVANQVLLGPKTTQRTHPRWEDMSVESFQGAVPLGVGDIGGRVFSLHKDKIRRILLFLDKIAVGDLPLALPARAMSPPSEYDAVAAAEGALLFKSCSQCSTSCLSSPSTTLVAPLPLLSNIIVIDDNDHGHGTGYALETERCADSHKTLGAVCVLRQCGGCAMARRARSGGRHDDGRSSH